MLLATGAGLHVSGLPGGAGPRVWGCRGGWTMCLGGARVPLLNCFQKLRMPWPLPQPEHSGQHYPHICVLWLDVPQESVASSSHLEWPPPQQDVLGPEPLAWAVHSVFDFGWRSLHQRVRDLGAS